MQWFSGDVPLYMFEASHSGYDYYVQIEYDAIVNIDLDEVVRKVAAQNVDLVALPEEGDDSRWHWLPTCLGFYRSDEITHLLVCLSIYSRSGLRSLAAKRLEQAAQFKSGAVTAWPMCEGYIATEARRQGLKIASLSDYGDVDAYRWWPPYAESEVPRLARHAFVHPVLDAARFPSSVLRNDLTRSVRKLLWPASDVHERLRQLGPIGYLRALFGKPYRVALTSALRRRFGSAADG